MSLFKPHHSVIRLIPPRYVAHLHCCKSALPLFTLAPRVTIRWKGRLLYGPYHGFPTPLEAPQGVKQAVEVQTRTAVMMLKRRISLNRNLLPVRLTLSTGGKMEEAQRWRKLRGPPRSSGGSARVSLPSLSAIVNIQWSHLRSFPQELFLTQPAFLLLKRAIVSGFFLRLPGDKYDNKSIHIPCCKARL